MASSHTNHKTYMYTCIYTSYHWYNTMYTDMHVYLRIVMNRNLTLANKKNTVQPISTTITAILETDRIWSITKIICQWFEIYIYIYRDWCDIYIYIVIVQHNYSGNCINMKTINSFPFLGHVFFFLNLYQHWVFKKSIEIGIVALIRHKGHYTKLNYNEMIAEIPLISISTLVPGTNNRFFAIVARFRDQMVLIAWVRGIVHGFLLQC